MIIEDLPTGSFLIFCLNAFISFFFQFVGFLLTYLLHTSHAAKYGSRAGLGLTLIQFGFYSRTMGGDGTDGNAVAGDPVTSDGFWSSNLNMTGTSPTTAPTPDDVLPFDSSRDWLSFLFMTIGELSSIFGVGIVSPLTLVIFTGWFLVLSSLIGFWRVKRWEQVLRTPAAPPTPEDLERERAVRRNFQDVFGIYLGEEEEERNRRPANSAEAEARLARDLRAAGLI